MTIDEAIKDLDIIRFNSHWDELVKEEYWQELMEMSMNALEEVQQYRAIGTVEELQDMKSNYFEALSDWRKYRKIGTLEECRAAMEKQTTKQIIDNTPTEDDMWYQCPACKGDLTKIRTFFCPYCGQELNWSDEE